MSFFRCFKDRNYGSRPALIVKNYERLAETAWMTASLKYVQFLRPKVSLHLSTNVEYRWKELQSEQRSCLGATPHYSSNTIFHLFGIRSRDSEKFFVHVPSWCSNYERSSLLVAPVPMVLIRHTTLHHRTERHSVFFRIDVGLHCVHALLFFWSQPYSGAWLTIFMCLHVPRLLLCRVFYFLSRHVRKLLWRRSECYLSQKFPNAILSGACGLSSQLWARLEWGSCVEWFRYICLDCDVLDSSVLHIINGKRPTCDVYVTKWIWVIFVGFKPGHRKTSAGRLMLLVQSLMRRWIFGTPFPMFLPSTI